MKAILQTGFNLSECGHAQAGGLVPVPPEKRFLKCMSVLESADGVRITLAEGRVQATVTPQRPGQSFTVATTDLTVTEGQIDVIFVGSGDRVTMGSSRDLTAGPGGTTFSIR